MAAVQLLLWVLLSMLWPQPDLDGLDDLAHACSMSAEREDPGRLRHVEASTDLQGSPQQVFEYLDDHRNLSSHMEASASPLMAGGNMQLILDEGQGRTIGSHVVMRGKVLGFDLLVDEVLIERVPFERKTWETVEDRLVVIGPYRLGFRLRPGATGGSTLTVWIDYELPARRPWLGRLAGSTYARWCVQQMLTAARARFA